MFFKMLKNDLKMKKGLSVILFIFISLASVLMFIGASQLYMQLAGEKRTYERCSSSDIIVIYDDPAEGREEKLGTIEKRISESDMFTRCFKTEGLALDAVQIDFDDVDEDSQESFFEKEQLVTTLPRQGDYVYDLEDRPFYVKNGTVWISHKMRDVTGASVGDSMDIITPMGRVYEFVIGGFYKETSDIYLFRYMLSDDDYAVISRDLPIKTDVFYLRTSAENTDVVSFFEEMRTEDDIEFTDAFWLSSATTDDYVIGYIITSAIILISLFMLVIILMTIRFTMVSAMRDEEKEIGMMRAMGIDSLSFRWLFAAKYIAFAIVGGAIGIAAGLPLSKQVMRVFSGGITLPQNYELMIAGTLSALLMTAAIVLFSMLVMRRINRISVIDAIHGENHGERFGRVSALFLHRQRSMPVSVYLGLSDILTRMKRYIFLVIAYTLGGMLILLTSYLYNSVISLDFLKYSMVYRYDFFPDFSDEMMKEYDKRETAENKFFWEIFNDDLDANGIQAHVYTNKRGQGSLLTGGKVECAVYFGFEDPSFIIYSEGKAPVLENEAALSSYTARLRGIKVGDEIDAEILEYSEDKLTSQYNEKKLIVTGLIDEMEWDGPDIIMGSDYDDAVVRGLPFNGTEIYGEDKQAEYDKMFELFDGHMMTAEEALNRYLEDYELPLRLLRDVVTGTVVFVNILLTMLYMNIFVSEDKSEIALQRCMGFGDGSIRSAQLFRMLTLTLFAALAAILLVNVTGARAFDLLFGTVGLSGFRFSPMPLLTWVMMPALSLITVLIPSLIRLRRIDRIDIGSISDE